MHLHRLNLIARMLAWKRYVEAGLAQQFETAAKLETALPVLGREVASLENRIEILQKQAESASQATFDFWLAALDAGQIEKAYFAGGLYQSFARRGGHVRMLAFEGGDKHSSLPAGSALADEIVEAVVSGKVNIFEAAKLREDEKLRWQPMPDFLARIRGTPELFRQIFKASEKRSAALAHFPSADSFFYEAVNLLAREPDLIDFVAQSQRNQAPDLAGTPTGVPLPFERREVLPPYLVPANPKRRSVAFLHNSYYHFNNLANALRKRGWDAVTVSLEAPDSVQRQFFHGEDINLFDPDPSRMQQMVLDFFRKVPERFGAVHFYGQGHPSFFHENSEGGFQNRKVPWDLLELRRHGIIIGYSPTGCADGALQSSISKVTRGLCGHCVWQLHPEVCSDSRNAAWIEKLRMVCDWVALDGDWVTAERMGPKFVKGPCTTALDPDKWRPDILVPEKFQITREDNELLVYHAVGNYLARRREGRDIKGTGAIMGAVDRLRAEGVPVRLFFATDIPSVDVRFYQIQADVVVDQLHYGRLGANARESLMLGLPVITNINAGTESPLAYVLETPIVQATEATIYAELKSLLLDKERRLMLGKAGRDFAVKWHSSDVCASRFEGVLERIASGLPPEDGEI